MKNRIVVETDGNGVSTYYPQYKVFLFWHNYTRVDCDCAWTITYDTLEKCQRFLNSHYKTRKVIELPDLGRD